MNIQQRGGLMLNAPRETDDTPALSPPVESAGKKRRSKYKHLDWEKHRIILKSLYMDQDKTLEETMVIMRDAYKIDASKQCYKRIFKTWGWQKNLPAHIACFMAKTAKKRKRENGQDTVFKYGGRVYTKEQAANTLARSKRFREDRDGVASDPGTPDGVEYYAPDQVDEVTSPAAQGRLVQPAREDAEALPLGPIIDTDTRPHHDDIEHTIDVSAVVTKDRVTSTAFTDFLSPILDRPIVEIFSIPLQLRFWTELRTRLLSDQDRHPTYYNNRDILTSNMEARRALLSGLFPGQNGASLFEDTVEPSPVHRSLAQTIPGYHLEEGNLSLSRFFRLPGCSITWQFALLALVLISNNFVGKEGIGQLLRFTVHDMPDPIFRYFFELNVVTVNAAREKLLEIAVGNGDCFSVDRLLDTGEYRGKLRGPLGNWLLWTAVVARQQIMVKYFLQEGADPNCHISEFREAGNDKNMNFDSLLHAAVSTGETDVVAILLGAGAEVNYSRSETLFEVNYGETPLAVAVRQAHLVSASLLLQAGADVDMALLRRYTPRGEGEHPQDYAYFHGHVEMYQLLETKASKSTPTVSGILAAARIGTEQLASYLQNRDQGYSTKLLLGKSLGYACARPGHEDSINTLLDFGVNLNEPAPSMDEPDPLVPWLTPLVGALRNYSTDTISRLLRGGAYITGQALKVAASEKQHAQLLHMLIRHVDGDIVGSYALEDALSSKNMDAFRRLMRAGAGDHIHPPEDVDCPSPLTAAAIDDNMEAVKELVHRSPGHIVHAISIAANRGNLEIVKLLAGSGVEINDLTLDGGTILAQCAKSKSPNRSAVFNFLLKAGADINGDNSDNPDLKNSPLTELILNPQDDGLIRLALQKGARVNGAPQLASRTPIQAAAEQGDLDLVKELYARGADLKAEAFYYLGMTALQAACDSELLNMSLVTFLLENGVDVHAKAADNSGRTALQAAAIRGHTNLVLRLITDHGANVNANPAKHLGRTALEGAAEHGRLDIVQILLAAGATPRNGDIGYERAVSLAEENGHFAVAELIEKHWTDRGGPMIEDVVQV